MHYFEIFPETFPAISELLGTPFPERSVIFEMKVFFLSQPRGVVGQVAVLQQAGGGLPEQFGYRYGHGRQI